MKNKIARKSANNEKLKKIIPAYNGLLKFLQKEKVLTLAKENLKPALVFGLTLVEMNIDLSVQ